MAAKRQLMAEQWDQFARSVIPQGVFPYAVAQADRA
jgi:hypothetical protein